MKRSLLFILGISFFTLSLYAVDLTISQPGVYFLGDDLESNTTTNPDSIILITASNVILDLADHTVRQLNLTPNVNGISINAGLTDITIRNGKINSVTGRGIGININDARITIENIDFIRCGNRGLSVDGSGGRISDITILNCRFYRCCEAAGADFIVSFFDATRIVMKDCIIAGTVNTITITAVAVQLTTASFFENIIIEGLTLRSLNGFFLNGSGVFPLGQPCEGNTFINCFVNQNIVRSTASDVPLNGFFVGNFCQYNIFKDCWVAQNTVEAQNAGVARLTGFVTNPATSTQVRHRNQFIGCKVLSNNMTGGNTLTSILRGFWAQAPDAQTFVDCAALNNFTLVGTAVGFDLTFTFAPATGSGISVIGSTFIQNVNPFAVGGLANNSFGVRFLNTTVSAGNLFTRNISSRNGTTAANQYLNLAAAAQAAYTTVSINTATGPFNNAAVT